MDRPSPPRPDGGAPPLRFTKDDGARVEQAGVPYAWPLGGSAIRLYYCVPGPMHSASSTDGLSFVEDPGGRIMGCDPTMVALPAGGYRLYYKVQESPDVHIVHSATSSDGLTFVDEGFRFAVRDAPCNGWTSVPDAVTLADGRVRLYFTCNKRVNETRSAISADGLTFTLEDGVRLSRAVDANVLRLPDGSFRMFYATNPGSGSVVPPQAIYTAVSADGLAWTVEGEVLRAGDTFDRRAVADPSGVLLGDGRFRVYYGGDDASGAGRILSAISQTIP